VENADIVASQRSTIDQRTTRHAGYVISQRKRKRIEEVFGSSKVVGLIRKVPLRVRRRVADVLSLAPAAYNLTRMRKLLAT